MSVDLFQYHLAVINKQNALAHERLVRALYLEYPENKDYSDQYVEAIEKTGNCATELAHLQHEVEIMIQNQKGPSGG